MKYPIKKLDEIIKKIQNLLSEYDKRDLTTEFNQNSSVEEKIKPLADFMAKMRKEVQSDIQFILSEIETKLEKEEAGIAAQIRPILNEIKRDAEHPTNALGYNHLAAKLSDLKGKLEFSKQKSKLNYSKWSFIIGIPLAIIGISLAIIFFYIPSLDNTQEQLTSPQEQIADSESTAQDLPKENVGIRNSGTNTTIINNTCFGIDLCIDNTEKAVDTIIDDNKIYP